MAAGLERDKGRRTRVVAGRIVLAIVVGLTVAGAVAVRQAMKPRATRPPPLPVPNAYDDLVRAGESIRGEPPNKGRIRGAKLDELKAWVGQNAEPLKIARAALGKPSRVPVAYAAGGESFGKSIGTCRMVGRLLLADAEIGALDKRPVDASRAYLDTLRLADAISRGGLQIDVLSGIAVEYLAIEGLSRLVDELPPDELRKIIPILLRHDGDRDPWPVIRNGEDYWSEQFNPPMMRLMLRVSGAAEKLRAASELPARQAIWRAERQIRSLAVRMAERAYELDIGSEPDDISELVPRYLPEVPKDPETGRPLVAAPTP